MADTLPVPATEGELQLVISEDAHDFPAPKLLFRHDHPLNQDWSMIEIKSNIIPIIEYQLLRDYIDDSIMSGIRTDLLAAPT